LTFDTLKSLWFDEFSNKNPLFKFKERMINSIKMYSQTFELAKIQRDIMEIKTTAVKNDNLKHFSLLKSIVEKSKSFEEVGQEFYNAKKINPID
jgi:hypothetical protein